jgi:hypothetical protein
MGSACAADGDVSCARADLGETDINGSIEKEKETCRPEATKIQG